MQVLDADKCLPLLDAASFHASNCEVITAKLGNQLKLCKTYYCLKFYFRKFGLHQKKKIATLLAATASCAEWGWPTMLGTIQDVYSKGCTVYIVDGKLHLKSLTHPGI